MSNNVTFPIAFPRECFTVVATAQTDGGFAVVWDFTPTSAIVGQKNNKATWLALGY